MICCAAQSVKVQVQHFLQQNVPWLAMSPFHVPGRDHNRRARRGFSPKQVHGRAERAFSLCLQLRSPTQWFFSHAYC